MPADPKSAAAGRQPLERLDLEAQQLDEAAPRNRVLEHRERIAVAAQLDLDLRALDAPRQQRAQLADIRNLVRRVDDGRVAAGVADALADVVLARPRVVDRRVVADERDELGDLRAEA